MISPSFTETAKCLDRQRLGKERLEASQILCAITDSTYGWQNHPAVNMWRGHPRLLCLYGLAICDEWVGRGYKDTLREKFFASLVKYDNMIFDEKYSESLPSWYNDERLFSSHRSNLLRKYPEWYNQFGWTEPNDLPYFWPV